MMMAALPLLGACSLALFIWLGALIPRNAQWQPPDQGIEILIETNGVHAGIIVPVANGITDWFTIFPDIPRHINGRPVTHIAIGWGEEEVFLNTPSWGDLRARTALRIMLQGGTNLIRILPLTHLSPGPWQRPLLVRNQEYARLARMIMATLPPPGADGARRVFRGFDPAAIHYQAKGRYTLMHGCNQQAADVLARTGIKIGWLTPFAGGVTRWFPPPDQSP